MDRAEHALQTGPLGLLARLLLLRRRQDSIFDFRERTVAEMSGQNEGTEAS